MGRKPHELQENNMPIIIKPDTEYDVSHWKIIRDFSVVTPKPRLVFTKATENYYGRDTKFPIYWPGIRNAGMRRGAFHFHRPGRNIEQANFFTEVLWENGFDKTDLLADDIEVPGVSLSEILDFLDRVQYLTGIRPLIYTSEIILEELCPRHVAPVELQDELLWIAEYPAESVVNVINHIPAWVIPAGMEYDHVVMWQYSEKGIIGGIVGNVDLNMVNPAWAARIGLTAPTGGVIVPYEFRYEATPAKALGSTLRDDHFVIAGNEAGSVAFGQVVYGDQEWLQPGERWIHVVKDQNGQIVDVWIAALHANVEYARVTVRDVTPTPTPTTKPTFKVTVEVDDPDYRPVSVEMKPNP